MNFRFGSFRLDTQRLELRRDDTPVAIEPQVFDLLRLLIEHRDRTVSRDEIIDTVWGGRIVSEATLSSRMNAVRRAVGDDGLRQAVIRTLPRRGFRFIQPVEVENEKATPSSGVTAGHVHDDAMFRRPAVAVLPFENISSDPEQDFFADGLTEDLITALSLWRSFPVIARNSTHAYKGQSPDIRQVGRELRAKYVIVGSVRKAGGKIRVTAQLINSENGHQIWAERYDREIADIFDLQDELSQRIAATVAPELDYSQFPTTKIRSPHNLDAWEFVQRGFRYVLEFDLSSIRRARQFFHKAVELDPTYARAYIGLGWSYHRELWIDRQQATDESKKIFIEMAQKAVALDEYDAEAHAILSMAHAWWHDIDSALLEAKRSVELNPNNAQGHAILGHWLALFGQPVQAIESMERAMLLSPRDPRQRAWLWNVGFAHLTAHNYEDAVLWLRRAIKLYPQNPDAHLVLASALGHLERNDEGRAALNEYKDRVASALKEPLLMWPYKHDSDKEHFLDGLRKAGWTD